MLHRSFHVIAHPLLLSALLVAAPLVHAQVSSDANVTTTVIDPAVIAAASDLDFGPIASNGKTTDGSHTRVVAPHDPAGDSAENGSPATLLISGASDQSYSIGLPKGSHLLKHENGRGTVTVENFTTGLPEGMLLSGEQTIHLGATVSLDAQQSPGLYTVDGGIPVIVHYN